MENLNLTEIDYRENLPPRFFDCAVEQVCEVFPRPTIVKVAGDESRRPVYFSTLLHGNETSGFTAFQKFFGEVVKGERKLERPVFLFFGNPRAAAKGKRHLPDRPDMNRIWDLSSDNPYHKLVSEVLEVVKEINPLCVIDVHNNTGKNPLYSCLHEVEAKSLKLCSLFSNTVVLFFGPIPAHSVFLSQYYPAATVEAGLSGDPNGLSRIEKLLETLSSKEAEQLFDDDGLEQAKSQVDVFQTVGRVEVEPEASIQFGYQGKKQSDLVFPDNFDNLNFGLLEEGSVIGYVERKVIKVVDGHGDDITERFFESGSREITLKRTVVPSMLTCDVDIVREDCLGYFMEKIDL